MRTNYIANDDCLIFMKNLEDKSVDMILTDPPYSNPTVTGFGRKIVKNVADLSMQEAYMRMLKKEYERILKPNAPVFMFCDDKYYPAIYRAFYDWKTVQLIVWDKGAIGMGKPFRKRHELIVYANRETVDYNRTEGISHYPTVLNYNPVAEKVHPAQKPVQLLRDLIVGFSNPDDIILDPFCGSGSTLVACKETGRKWIGCELNCEYFELASKMVELT